MEVRPVGPAALLLDLDTDAEAAADVTVAVEAWRAELWRRWSAGDLVASDIVPGARTVLLDGVPDPAGLARQIAGWPPPAPAGSAGAGLVEIPVRYDGPDLDSVAECWGVVPEEVVARHLATEFRVAFCGFTPGFAYLTGLPERYHLPRRATPRPSVPPGSVAVAGPYTGVYPRESPGGWHLIGTTDADLWDLGRAEPALLTPGATVRFVPASTAGERA